MYSPPPLHSDTASQRSVSSPRPWSELSHETASRTSTIRRPNGDTSAHGTSSKPSNPERRSVSDGYPRSPPSDYHGSIEEDYLGENLLDDTDAEQEYDPAYDSPSYDASKPQQGRPVSRPGPDDYSIPKIPSLQDSNRLVVGIDFGTTYTGMAFATPRSDVITNLDEIELVSNWGTKMENDEKIPSVLSYSKPSAAKEEQFGANLSNDAVTMVNTKLDLDVQETKLAELESLIAALEGMKNLQFSNVKKQGGRPGYSWKSAEDIVTDYLEKVFQAFSKFLDKLFREFSPKLKQEVPMDLVITVPVQWSYKARNSTYRAVKNAGFNDRNFLKMENVIMIEEPQAAALYAVRYLKERDIEFLKVGDCFVLCDAGGGTVDVVSYRVTQLEPRLELKQIGESMCRKCGSIYIDAKFKEWLRAMLGNRWRELDPKSVRSNINTQTTEGEKMRKVMSDFDGFKKAFTGKEHRNINFYLPRPLNEVNVRNVIKQGNVTISHEQMRAFFDDSINGTIELILNQIVQAESERRRVKNVVMVGGFAESEYLQYEIEDCLKLKNIKLRRPKTSWTAVVQGAVINGVEHISDLTPLKPCPANYGIRLNEDFSGINDNWEDRYVEATTSRVMVKGQMHWLILKGDLLDDSKDGTQTKICPFTFTERDSRKFKFSIYEYNSEDPDDVLPKSYHNSADELTTVFELEVDMSSIPLEHMQKTINHGRPYWIAETTCEMNYTTTHQIEAKLTFDRRVVASCKKDLRPQGDPYGDSYD